MAKLIDTDGTVISQTTEFSDLIDPEVEAEKAAMEAEEAPQLEEAEAPEPEAPVEDDLPEKYQGKSAAEIAKMHRELETRLGQQSQEVGELRRAFDDMVQNSIKAQQTTTPEPVEADDPIDFYSDPDRYIERKIANDPRVKQAEAIAAQMGKTEALTRLQAAHPDMQEVISSEGFKQWVGKSPYRQQMHDHANANYDFGAANELLTLYKESLGAASTVQKVEKVAQKAAVKKASTGSSRSAAPGNTPKKTYRRVDLIELHRTNPRRYEAMQDEIMAAYAEGRVIK
jgi:hypothetical protein